MTIYILLQDKDVNKKRFKIIMQQSRYSNKGTVIWTIHGLINIRKKMNEKKQKKSLVFQEDIFRNREDGKVQRW